MAELDPVIGRSKLTVTPRAVAAAPPVRSDRQKVKQIVVNLLSNALKFTHQGGIDIAVQHDPSRRRWYRSRSATPESALRRRHHERIFEDFRQVDDSPSRQYGGTGLGLAICRRLATSLGGRITLRSNLGQRFDVHLDDPAGTAAMSTEQGPLILVVDDYEDAREMYAEYLRFCGFRVAEARNGNEALEQAFALVPDLILMDLSLPGMDGWEATRQLKSDERTRNIPVVALTGHALAGASEGATASRLRFVRHQTVPSRRSRRRGTPDAEHGQERVKAPARRTRRRVDETRNAMAKTNKSQTSRRAPRDGRGGARRAATAGRGDAAQQPHRGEGESRQAVRAGGRAAARRYAGR